MSVTTEAIPYGGRTAWARNLAAPVRSFLSTEAGGAFVMLGAAIAAFEALDPSYAAASRTLGAGPARTFLRIVLPLARGGLIAGLALSFARGLGEFGATIMFAGSLQRVTQTLPLAIYAEFDQNFNATLAISGVLVIISAVLLLALRIGLTWQRSDSTTSPSLFGLSGSS